MSADTRARARTDASSMVLEREAVVYCDAQLHLLDPVATLVWQCADGEVSVDALGVELAAVFGPGADVAAAISLLAERGLLEAADGTDTLKTPDTTAELREAAVRILTDAPGACATCAERADWAACSTYRVGEHIVGLGTDHLGVDAALCAALAQNVVDCPEAPAYYALTVADGGDGPGPRALYVLHRGPDIVLRTREPGRALRGAVAELASYSDLSMSGLAALPALAVGGSDGVVLVPQPSDPSRLARAVEPFGLRIADGGVAVVDVERRQVVVGAVGLEPDLNPLGDLAAELPDLGSEPVPLPWARYPLVGLAADSGTVTDALLAFGPVAGDVRQHGALDALAELLSSSGAPPLPVAALPADAHEWPDAITTVLGTRG